MVPDTLSEKKIGFFKRIVYYFLNKKFLKTIKKNSIQCKLKIPNINFQYKNLKLSKVLNYFKDQEIGNHGSLNEQINVVRELFKKKKNFLYFF